jgi:hypothetical protein
VSTLARLTLAAAAGFGFMFLMVRWDAGTPTPSGIVDVHLQPMLATDSANHPLRLKRPVLLVILDPRCTHCRTMRDEWNRIFAETPARVSRHLIFTRPDTTGFQDLIDRSGARASWTTPQELSHHTGIRATPVTLLLNVRGQVVWIAHGTFDASITKSFVQGLAKFR